MRASDLDFVVDEHLRHFPDGFFARLGPAFLTEYYRGFLTGQHACTTVAEVAGRPAGYLVGVTDPPAHREHVVRRHGRKLVVRGVAAMARRPSLAWCFLRTRAVLYARKLLYRRRGRPHAEGSIVRAEQGAGRTAVLTHVAVAPQAQSGGIGSELIRRFDDEVTARGCERITLVTASGDNGAGPYYRRRGWEPHGERRTPDGLWLTTYERPVQARLDDRPSCGSADTA